MREEDNNFGSDIVYVEGVYVFASVCMFLSVCAHGNLKSY